MMTSDLKKRGLGRGLSALLPTAAAPSPIRMNMADKSKTYFSAQIEDVYPGPEQPRTSFDDAELAELAESIKVHGVIVPLVVRPRPDGGYFLIAGERRWRAAQRAGLHDVPVVVQEVDSQVAFERALVENLQRSDLGPIEEAVAFQRLVDEFGLTQ
jgi:ParB family chromosome partitioning protein